MKEKSIIRTKMEEWRREIEGKWKRERGEFEGKWEEVGARVSDLGILLREWTIYCPLDGREDTR